MLEQQIINGLMLGSVYVLVAVAFTLTIGVLNFLNFSLPAIFMLGGMFTWMLLTQGVHWLAVLLIALAIGAAVSLVVERFTYRWQRSSDHFVPLVSSMAFLILIENLVLIYWGSDLHTVKPPFENVSVRIGHLLFSVPQLLALIIAVALVAGLSIVLNRTSVGRGLRAIAENTDTAIMLGVDVFKVVPAVFLISGVFTALGGVLFAVNYQQVSFNMGEAVALKGISAMVVGGMGNIWGAIIGGLLIGVVEALSTSWFGADFSKITVYGLLIAILIVRPTGLLGGATLGRARL